MCPIMPHYGPLWGIMKSTPSPRAPAPQLHDTRCPMPCGALWGIGTQSLFQPNRPNGMGHRHSIIISTQSAKSKHAPYGALWGIGTQSSFQPNRPSQNMPHIIYGAFMGRRKNWDSSLCLSVSKNSKLFCFTLRVACSQVSQHKRPLKEILNQSQQRYSSQIESAVSSSVSY